ncbi:sugar ABC transporter substrate-binding protein [Arsenicitalea aurantiaca]|uniref:Sugar ABC transporter substrate-binding protein n=1 Tax=Arsenicitalea aurantiaca TaxID=1783274 RepID=A0A433X5B1_9HYPH|nr:sugar ABC transporter substrate-binding protein [Arsenicitalea aurantiaca]RUT29265.1 sugar ABC transporter substrate-binding protein [Arsenicitalea aurantiaca]
MISPIDRRTVLKWGGGMLGASALMPRLAFGQQTSINYWHTFTSQSEFAGLEAVMAQFASAHPDINVIQENIPNPEFMAKITAAVVGGGRPDVTMVASERFADLRAMGALVDLTDRIASWERRGDFEDARFASITSEDGAVYGVPAFAFVDWMYYRKDWFDEAGLSAPTTLDEMLVAAQTLTDPAKGRYGFGMRGGAGGQAFVVNLMEAFGSPVLSNGEIGLDRDRAIEAVRWYAGLLTEHGVVPPSAPNDGFRQIMEAFQTGQTAMVWHHTGSFRDISGFLEPGVEFATAPIPAGPAARVARLGYAYNAMSSDANADAAWEWIKFWGEPDAAVALLEATGYFPASTVAAQDERISGNPLYAPAAETLGFGLPQPSFPGFAGWSESVVLPAFQRVLIGDATPEQAVDEMIDGLAAAVG